MEYNELYKKYIDTGSISEELKEFDIFTKLVESGHLVIGEGRNKVNIESTCFKGIKDFIRTLFNLYSDAWDFKVKVLTERIILTGFYIHFPEVTIKNSKKLEHDIKDLFVILDVAVSTTGLSVGAIRGFRTSVTRAEYTSYYGHSHISSFSWPKKDSPEKSAQPFCTGSGEINDYRLNLNSKCTEENCIAFLLQLMTLVNWESLQGTPYKYISNIKFNPSNSGPSYVSLYVDQSDKNNFFDGISILTYKGDIDSDYLDITLINGELVCNIDEHKLLSYVKDIPYFSRYIGYVVNGMVRTVESVQRVENHGGRFKPILTPTPFIFNNKKFYFNIYDNVEEGSENKTNKTNKKDYEQGFAYSLISEFKNWFSRRLKEEAITRSIQKRASKSGDAG